jgi:hypothetical protein
MNQARRLPLLLMLVGAMLGAALGLALFTTGLYAELAIGLSSLTALGASTGYVVGAIIGKRAAGSPVEKFSNVGIAVFMLSGSVFFVVSGLRSHSLSTVYNGLLFAIASLMPLGWKSLSSMVYLYVAFATVSVVAFVTTSRSSWAMLAALFVLATIAAYYSNRYENRLR